MFTRFFVATTYTWFGGICAFVFFGINLSFYSVVSTYYILHIMYQGKDNRIWRESLHFSSSKFNIQLSFSSVMGRLNPLISMIFLFFCLIVGVLSWEPDPNCNNCNSVTPRPIQYHLRSAEAILESQFCHPKTRHNMSTDYLHPNHKVWIFYPSSTRVILSKYFCQQSVLHILYS